MDSKRLAIRKGIQDIEYATDYHDRRKKQREPFVENLLACVGESAKNMRFLSIGCGFAGEEALLTPHFAEVVLLDQYPKTISLVKDIYENLGLENVKFISKDFRQYKPEKEFDIIYTSAPSDWMKDTAFDKVPNNYSDFVAKHMNDHGVFIARIYSGKYNKHRKYMIKNNRGFRSAINKSIRPFGLKLIRCEISPIYSESNVLVIIKEHSKPLSEFKCLDKGVGEFK